MTSLAIVSAIGSRGDVNPMLALARELRTRGWDILFLTSEPYKQLGEAAGFETISLIDAQRFDEFVSTPKLWSPFHGLRVVLGDTASELIEPTFEIMHQNFRPGETLLVSHPLDFAARVFRDLHPSVPHASTLLAPMAVRTPKQPARLTSWWYEARWPPQLVNLQFRIADTLFVDRWLGNPLNAFRKKIGLPAIKHPLAKWYLSPDLVLGLFPDWFAPPASMLPAQMRCTGFPLEDASREMDADQTDWLDGILSPFDSPPVVFAPGTANTQAKHYFKCAIQACESVGCNGLLLTEHASQLPSQLPKNVRHESYVPFRSLLPRCRGIAHHGGIGTTSQSLAAGIPQLILPMAFDQFDNARWVERLGCGETLFHRRLSARRLTNSLNALLLETSRQQDCQSVAARFHGATPVASAVDEIERMVNRRQGE